MQFECRFLAVPFVYYNNVFTLDEQTDKVGSGSPAAGGRRLHSH